MRHGGLGLLDPFALLERAGVTKGWWVADLGCGSLGHFVFPAASLVGAQGRVYAVDVQRSAIRCIERGVREHQAWHIQPVWADVEHPRSTSLGEASIDLTIIVNALYLAQARERWAERAWRMTKPGGSALVIDWHPQAAPLGPSEDLRLSPDNVRTVFVQQGWLEEIHEAAGDHHYAFLFRRPPEDGAHVEFISHPA